MANSILDSLVYNPLTGSIQYKIKGRAGRQEITGFSTGYPGVATQITNRSTGVTVPSSLRGTITTDTTSLAAEGSADFVVTNAAVGAGDVVVVAVKSGVVGAGTLVTVTAVASGSFSIRVHNGNVAAGTAETGAIVINYAVIKAT